MQQLAKATDFALQEARTLIVMKKLRVRHNLRLNLSLPICIHIGKLDNNPISHAPVKVQV